MVFLTVSGAVDNDALERGAKQPLLISSLDSHQREANDDEDQDEELEEEAPEETRKPATSLASAYRLLTPSVKVSDFNRITNFKLLNIR